MFTTRTNLVLYEICKVVLMLLIGLLNSTVNIYRLSTEGNNTYGNCACTFYNIARSKGTTVKLF